MKKVKTNLLRENQNTNRIYSIDQSQFQELVLSIKREGILEPLVVRPFGTKGEDITYEIISGNRRFRAAICLKMDEVPVIIKDLEEVSESLIVAHQTQRTKTPSEIMHEIRIINEKYGLKQGVRTDSDPKLKKGKDEMDKLINKHNKSKIDKLKRIDKILDKLETSSPGIKTKEMKWLDNSGSIDGTLKRLIKVVKNKSNEEKVGGKYEITEGDFKVYQKSSKELTDIKDNSVACIITSPPYFDIRDYNLGAGELGHERTVDRFVKRLVNHFNDSKRVLKNDGTLWVNIGDYVKDYGYTAVPEKFMTGMLKKGWILHDKIIWVKNNPIPSTANRCVLANEYIYVFKKDEFVKFDTTWIKEYPKIAEFTTHAYYKLKSVFDFRDNVIKTNSANNSVLSKECESKGIHLTHNATFPLTIPFIAIKTSSVVGDLIVDPFNGTGTTGRACKLLGRKYVGYDLNSTYIKQSEIRLNAPMENDVELIKKAA